MKRALIVIASIASCLLLMSNASAFPSSTWHAGDEVAMLGHSFEEEYWTNESIPVKSDNNDNLTFSASYVNSSGVQAFLLALNKVENANGTGTIPLQLFGMHYTTPEGREVFIASVFAFLMVFDDTYNGTGAGMNGLPDPGNENISYVVPFGVAALVNATYVPETNVLPVEKLGEGHFRFGVQYLNQYAIVTPNFIGSMTYRTGWLAKFSELSVTYEVTVNNETGEVTAESWYTIGQVTELWLFILGIPIKVNPKDIPDTLGLSVVHFVTTFTSKYKGVAGNTSGKTFNPNINKPVGEDIVLKIGEDNERAMKIGTRGTFDLINESNDAIVKNDEPANCGIVAANMVDLLLVGWQLGFAAGAMSVFAYALSEDIQAKYAGPMDLANRSINPGNSQGFNANSFWYGVAFPKWNGYRVEHDPVYTAYTNIAESQANDPNANARMGVLVLIAIIAVVAVVVVAIATRKQKPG